MYPKLVMAGTASFTLGLSLVPLIGKAPFLYLAAFFVAIGQGLSYPALTAIVSRASPASEQGSMLGLASSIGSLARFCGPIAIGALYDIGGAQGAFYGGALLTFVAFLITLRIGEGVR